MNLREYYFNRFFINLNFDLRVLAQKCLKPCVNGVLKIQFFFLNLSSKVLAGIGVRTSKYPYMDMPIGGTIVKTWKREIKHHLAV